MFLSSFCNTVILDGRLYRTVAFRHQMMATIAIFHLNTNGAFDHARRMAVVLVMLRYVRIRELPWETTSTILDGNFFDAGIIDHFCDAQDDLFHRTVVDILFDTVLSTVWHFVRWMNMDLNVFVSGEGESPRPGLSVGYQTTSCIRTKISIAFKQISIWKNNGKCIAPLCMNRIDGITNA